MSDLYGACVLMAALSAGLFVLTARGTRSAPTWACNLLGVALVAALFGYIQLLWYNVQLAQWLPFSSLIVLGNWLPLLSAALAGVVWRRTSGAALRRPIYVGGLFACGAYAMVYPLLGASPKCGDHWDPLDTCLQTTDHTCSPACAATLLRGYGIAATEDEMAQLCLTRRGTNWQGLYRGLKLKTAGTPWDVEVRRCTLDELPQLADRPLIASVGLARNAAADTEFSREFGWTPGANHSVVITKLASNGAAVVADPSQEFSREHWDADTLSQLWQGYAIRLVERR